MSKPNDDIFRLRELAIDRDEARASLKENATDTKEKLRPSNLAKRAKKIALNQAINSGQKVTGTVKNNPIITGSVLVAATVAVFHKPIGKLISKGLSSLSQRNQKIEE